MPAFAAATNSLIGAANQWPSHTLKLIKPVSLTLLYLAIWGFLLWLVVRLAGTVLRCVAGLFSRTDEEEEKYFAQVRKVLDERGWGRHQDCPSLTELIKSVHYEQRSTQRKLKRYKWMGAVLLIAIPIVSALVSVSANAGKELFDWTKTVAWLSLLLTLMTVVNSALRPSERFRRLCRLGIAMQRAKSDLLLDLEALPASCATAAAGSHVTGTNPPLGAGAKPQHGKAPSATGGGSKPEP
jgi:hypothetical protein